MEVVSPPMPSVPLPPTEPPSVPPPTSASEPEVIVSVPLLLNCAPMPVVPVPLIATVLLRQEARPLSELEMKAEVEKLIEQLESRGAHVYIPRKDLDYAITVGLRMLRLRRLLRRLRLPRRCCRRKCRNISSRCVERLVCISLWPSARHRSRSRMRSRGSTKFAI